jgi:hypothetical protein
MARLGRRRPGSTTRGGPEPTTTTPVSTPPSRSVTRITGRPARPSASATITDSPGWRRTTEATASSTSPSRSSTPAGRASGGPTGVVGGRMTKRSTEPVEVLPPLEPVQPLVDVSHAFPRRFPRSQRPATYSDQLIARSALPAPWPEPVEDDEQRVPH